MEGLRYTGRSCTICRKPIEIIPGRGVDQAQMLATRCVRCSKRIAAAAAKVIYERYSKKHHTERVQRRAQRRQRQAEAARQRRQRKKAAGPLA